MKIPKTASDVQVFFVLCVCVCLIRPDIFICCVTFQANSHGGAAQTQLQTLTA